MWAVVGSLDLLVAWNLEDKTVKIINFLSHVFMHMDLINDFIMH